jgi:alanine racemase
MARYTSSEDFNKVYVNLANLKSNFQALKEFVGDRQLMAVVKGDAYGHGLIECSRALVEAGAASLGVLDVSEGLRIRKAKITTPDVFILAGIDSAPAVKVAIFNNLSVVAYDFEQLELLGRAASESSRRLKVYLKVDTGMGRLGVSPDRAVDFIKKSQDFAFLDVLGLSTHLPAIGDLEAVSQLKGFLKICTAAEKILKKPLTKSALSGGAILAHPSFPDGMSRPGLILYGVPPLFDASETARLPEPWIKKTKGEKDQVKDQSQGKAQGKKKPAPKTLSGKGKKTRGKAEAGASAEIKAKDPRVLVSILKPVMRVTSRIIQLKTLSRGESVSYDRTFVAEKDILVAAVPFGYVHGFSSSRSGKTSALVRGEKVPQIGRICMNLSMFDVSGIPGISVGEEVTFLGEALESYQDAYLRYRGEKQNPYEVLCLYGRLNNRYYV